MAEHDTRPAPQAVATTRRRRRWIPAAAVGAVVVLAAALVVFQPWKLVVDDVVDEALPEAAASAPAAPSTPAPPSASPVPAASASASAGSGTPSTSPRPATRTLATGTFISHEHATSGTVRLLALADGRQVLRLEGLDTSNGPDLKVWLTDQEVVDGPSGWRVFDDGRYVDLGSLKGNRGNQNYVLPADVRLDGLTSVSIWCDRFDVSFGAAELTSA